MYMLDFYTSSITWFKVMPELFFLDIIIPTNLAVTIYTDSPFIFWIKDRLDPITSDTMSLKVMNIIYDRLNDLLHLIKLLGRCFLIHRNDC